MRFHLPLTVVLVGLALAACGSEKTPASLDSALLRRAELPSGLPALTASVSNGAADEWVRVTTPDPAARERNLAELRRAGFQRGSARQFRAAGSHPKILLLIEAVAQLKDSDGAQRLAERTLRRARRQAKRNQRRDLEAGELGEFRGGLRSSVGGITVYAIIWRKGRLLYYLSVASNPNGGPRRNAVVALAQRLDERWSA